MRPLLVLACLVAGLAQANQPQLAFPDIDFQGRFYRSVFVSGPGTLSSGDIAQVPEPVRGQLSRYLVRRTSFKSAYESNASGFEEAASDAKKRALERAIVSLVETPDASTLAVAFVKDAPIAHEWKVSPDVVVKEISYAEDFLKRMSSSAITPFVHVFIAHRQRVAFEMLELATRTEEQKAAAGQYRAFIDRARASTDRVWALLADDLDRQPFVHVKSATHPRDFGRSR